MLHGVRRVDYIYFGSCILFREVCTKFVADFIIVSFWFINVLYVLCFYHFIIVTFCVVLPPPQYKTWVVAVMCVMYGVDSHAGGKLYKYKMWTFPNTPTLQFYVPHARTFTIVKIDLCITEPHFLSSPAALSHMEGRHCLN